MPSKKNSFPPIDPSLLFDGGETRFREFWSDREILRDKWLRFSPLLLLISIFLFLSFPQEWKEDLTFQVLFLLYFVLMLPAEMLLVFFGIKNGLKIRKRVFGEDYCLYAEDRYLAEMTSLPFPPEACRRFKNNLCRKEMPGPVPVLKKQVSYTAQFEYRQPFFFEFSFLFVVDGRYTLEDLREKTDRNRVNILFILHLLGEGSLADPENEKKVESGYEIWTLGTRKIRVGHMIVDPKERRIWDRPRVLMLSDRELFLKWFFPFSGDVRTSPIRDYARDVFEDSHAILSSRLSLLLPN